MTEGEQSVFGQDRGGADLGKSIFPTFAVNAPMPRDTAVPAPRPTVGPNPDGTPTPRTAE